MSRFLTQDRRGCNKRQAPGSLLHFPAGTTLPDLDHASKRMYLLRSGHIQLCGSRQEVVDHLAAGDFFGEKCLLTLPRKDQVARSLSPVTVDSFQASELVDRVTRDRSFATRVLRNLALRLDRCQEALGDLMKETAERRLVRLLLRLGRGRKAAGLVRLPFDLSNRELANAIGTTRWNVSHFMSRLQRLGLVRRQEGIWIDREKLVEFLETA